MQVEMCDDLHSCLKGALKSETCLPLKVRCLLKTWQKICSFEFHDYAFLIFELLKINFRITAAWSDNNIIFNTNFCKINRFYSKFLVFS